MFKYNLSTNDFNLKSLRSILFYILYMYLHLFTLFTFSTLEELNRILRLLCTQVLEYFPGTFTIPPFKLKIFKYFLQEQLIFKKQTLIKNLV